MKDLGGVAVTLLFLLAADRANDLGFGFVAIILVCAAIACGATMVERGGS